MYGFYDDMIEAAERALECFGETEELLEYPEVQADKAYYLSVLKKYNELKFLKDKLSALKAALEEERAAVLLLAETGPCGERTAICEEIARLKRTVSSLSDFLADTLGCKHLIERVYCRFRCKETSAKFGAILYLLMKLDLLTHGANIEDEKLITAKGGYPEEISFVAEGQDVITRLSPLVGAHKVFTRAKSEELCFAVTPLPRFEKPKESDFKIDVFRSTGAGGQNINKVETAVRVTHLPTGLVVTCQDERSQLRNKKRALETIEKRLREQSVQAEKERIEADIRAQYANKHTSVSFDAAAGTFTDKRLSAFSNIPFPFDESLFTSYINGLIVL